MGTMERNPCSHPRGAWFHLAPLAPLNHEATQSLSGLQWLDIELFLTVDQDLAAATVACMRRAFTHMSRWGVSWDLWIQDPRSARDVVRPFLAEKKSAGHRDAARIYERLLNQLARYVAQFDDRYRGLQWELTKPRPAVVDPFDAVELQSLAGYRCQDAFVERRRRALLWICRETGLRRSEIACLRVQDVQDAPSRLYVRRPAKGGLRRWIPLHPGAWSSKRCVQAWLSVHGGHGSDALWITQDGVPMTIDGISREMDHISQDLGIRVNFNRYRHTRLTQLHRLGVREMIIKYCAGWKPKDTLAHYFQAGLEDALAEFYRCKVPGWKRSTRSQSKVV